MVKHAWIAAENADHVLLVQTVSKTVTKQVSTAEGLIADHALLFVQMDY
jgi:hypothetical protein